jgi:FkbM family methyltransferase
MDALLDNPPVRLKRCRHGPMAYLVNDFIGRSLDRYGEYCEGELAILADVLGPGDVAVDVGANIGVHTVCMAQAVGRTGRVVAFEPQRVIHQLLCANVALNGLPNVHAVHAASGAEPGEIVVPPIDYAAAGQFNFGGLELGGWEAGERTPVVPVDALGLAACRFIKVDVEGMELAVLEGAQRTIARCRPVLYVENNRREASPALIAWLTGAGYRPFWHVTPYFNPANHFGETEDVFPNQVAVNLVSLPAERGDAADLPEATEPQSWWQD